MQTPFRKAPAVGALYVTAYGAVGDGETDDTEAIQACIDAAFEQSKNVFLPAGTYLVSPAIVDEEEQTYALVLRSNVKVFSAIVGSAIITFPTQTEAKQIFYGSGVDYAEIAELTITTPDPGDLDTRAAWYPCAVFLVGCDDCKITNVRVEHMRQGVKVGSGATCNRLTVSGLVAHDCITAVYLDDITVATFTGCDLRVVDNDTIGNHCIYMESEVHNVDFYDSYFSGAGKYVVHAYLEGAYTSSYVKFDSCDFVSTEITILIGSKWSYVSFVNGCTFTCAHSQGPFLFYGGDHVTVSDFTASSPYYLLSREATVTDVLFENGTFDGVAYMPQSQDGITFTNVDIV
jgi:uncharacterized protein YjbI with pentapeptide repeats